MTNKEFKEFLVDALIYGFEPITNITRYKDCSEEEIKTIINSIPNLEMELPSYMDYINCYIDIFEDEACYIDQYMLLKVAKEQYGSSLLYHNREYASTNKILQNRDKNNKNNENIDKNDKLMYNKDIEKKEEKKNYSIDTKILAKAIKINGESRNEVAKELGMSPRTLERKLKGDTDFKAIELLILLKRYDINVDKVLKEE